MEEQCEQLQLQEKLIEELVEIPEKLDEPSYLCAAFCPWKMREEIFPLLTEKDKEKEEPLKLDLKPLPHRIEIYILGRG